MGRIREERLKLHGDLPESNVGPVGFVKKHNRVINCMYDCI